METLNEYWIEACVDSVESAVSAEKNGANRLELCSHLEVDGLSPSIDLVKEVLDAVTIPVKVMIRPRQGNFLYTQKELLKMTGTIYAMKDIGVYGIVFGILNKYNLVDSVNTASLAEVAKPLNVTFHKAIDYTSDLIKNVEVLNDITSVDAILTSGGKATAMHGKPIINELYDTYGTSGRRLEIIAAGRITHEKLDLHKEELKTTSLHGRHIVES